MRYSVAAIFFLHACTAFGQLVGPSNVFSARIDSAVAVTDKASIHVIVKNTAEHPITAFSVGFSHLNASGERIPCGGRGVNMIDWSDPMPGRNLFVHMRRSWVSPKGTATLDGYPKCPDGQVPLEQIEVVLSLVMFDDGTGEGVAAQIESILRVRQQARAERLKWMPRFSALRSATDLKGSARSLYQELVDATRQTEIDPDNAVTQGAAGPVRDEMQNLALEITQWAGRHESLAKNDVLEWRLTDLEQRTARLVKGAGVGR
jgi:hypothetical protein